MTRATASFFLLLLLIAPRAEGEESMREIGSISGTAVRAIQSATPKLEKNGLQLEEYMVSVFERDSSFVVLFDDPKRPAGHRGSTSSVAGFEVEVSKSGFRVLRANFVR